MSIHAKLEPSTIPPGTPAHAPAPSYADDLRATVRYILRQLDLRDGTLAGDQIDMLREAVEAVRPKLSQRAIRSIGYQTFTNSVTIELGGHEQCGTSFDCEVDFFKAAKGYAPSWDDPGAPSEYEIVSVLPYKIEVCEGRRGTRRVYLDCPLWLEELLMDCVDVGYLNEARS